MVRLILTLTPVVCMLSGIAFSILFSLFLKEDEVATLQDSDSDEGSNEKSSRNMYDKVGILLYSLDTGQTRLVTKTFYLGWETQKNET